ncbi:RNA-binding protein [Sinimarinibacterium sp. CAU 1509]|uniref:RNA recognition motif domain-containing protein n=1 Tax=Sinimarinibacterium sp. CAU 1509 TaxID=2562283 RepID=UPI0010ABD44B|nr:RNA-binding protein [Sinimarinibacterium sp. CAU 1509]TJY56683.1 RNA-binding protein [Sinimarinibacterium sp. CAU 1509]
MKRIFAGNLPEDTTERELTEIFTGFGRVFSIKLMQDVFSGKCRGFGFVEMEGHEARAAIAGLNGKELRGKPMKVNEEQPRDNKRGGGSRRR